MNTIEELIRRTLGVDLSNPATRQRAWRRIRVFQEIADECEKDGNKRMAEVIRKIYNSAIRREQDDESLFHLAILAGPENTDE